MRISQIKSKGLKSTRMAGSKLRMGRRTGSVQSHTKAVTMLRWSQSNQLITTRMLKITEKTSMKILKV